MDWKEDLGDYFATNDMFRIQYLNDKLVEYCKEYMQYINEFNGVKGTLKQGEPTYGYMSNINKNEMHIDIVVGNMKEIYPFILSCYFDMNANLIFDYSKYLDYKRKMFEGIGVSKDKMVIYTKENEVCSEDEKIEKGYIFQLLNNALKKHIDTQINK